MRGIKIAAWTLTTLLAGGTAVTVSTAASASAAVARPAGCSAPKPTLSEKNGLLKGRGTSTCDAALTRTLHIEIKWNKSYFPDPLTAKSADSGTKKKYDAQVSTCDGGAKRGYYARAYFTRDDNHHDTSPRDIRSCG
ncbi:MULTISPECIES: hypothetical protein [unclassified Streptomyces]|uniref:hypothetical protein n=1 Tax=unclassified Streptomyces TaxID=2593676 RepID=UPI002E292FEC|nr:hypothetical protein [Streptomyces sp. NBC_01429]